MKGDPAVMVALQEAILLEENLANQYCIAAIDQTRFGLHSGAELKELAGQCCDWKKEMIRRLFFLEGDPILKADPVKTTDSLEDMLNKLYAMEQTAADKYVEFTKLCYDKNDISNFHWFQHMSKWHTVGDDKYKGNMAYLQKELWQMDKLGENDYIAVHLGPKT
jgi:bacterioferritin (cytochrome b1)